MNYIRQINSFYNHLEFNPVSNSAVLLWHVLMQINNKTGWKEEFTVAATVLAIKANLKDSTFKRAREELKEKGYIHFRSRGGNQAAVYQVISLTGFMDHSNDDSFALDYKNDQTNNDSNDDTVDHTSDFTMDPLIKQEEVKKDNKKRIDTTNTFQFYKNNFGKDPSPYIKSDITYWITELGEALVVEAMKIAVEKNNLSWSYVKGIMKKWKEEKLSTIEQVEANQKNYRFQKSKNQEVIPDWFRQQKDIEKPLSKSAQADEEIDVVKMLSDFNSRKKVACTLAL